MLTFEKALGAERSGTSSMMSRTDESRKDSEEEEWFRMTQSVRFAKHELWRILIIDCNLRSLGWRSLPGVLLFSLHDHLDIIAIRSDLYANPSLAIFLANESTNADPKIHLSTENMSFRKRIYHTMRPNTHATRSPQGSQNAIIIVTMYRFLGSFRDKWVSNPSTEWLARRDLPEQSYPCLQTWALMSFLVPHWESHLSRAEIIPEICALDPAVLDLLRLLPSSMPQVYAISITGAQHIC